MINSIKGNEGRLQNISLELCIEDIIAQTLTPKHYYTFFSGTEEKYAQ